MSKIPAKDWNEVLKRVELVSVTPFKIHSERKGSLHALDEIDREIDVSVSGSHSVGENGDYLLVISEFKTSFGDEKNSFECQIGYQLIYSFDPPLEKDLKDAADEFAKVNSTFNAWPYFRHHAQMLSMELGLSALTVPLYKQNIMRFKDRKMVVDKSAGPEKDSKNTSKKSQARKPSVKK